MGAFQSSSLNEVINQISQPLQKSPVSDGASGLHYSGQQYTNQVQLMTQDICSGSSAVPYSAVADNYATVTGKNGVATDTLPIDAQTKRISAMALQGYVQNLMANGVIPGPDPDINTQIAADKAFYASVQAEYCFYEARYLAALTQFITVVSARNGAPGTAELAATVSLNKKLNSLLEIISYVGNDRAQQVNLRNTKITQANADVVAKLESLKKQQDFLQTADVRLQTQQEMMRFSKEKSDAMNIQIMFFVAINVVALGTVFTVYKNVSGRASM